MLIPFWKTFLWLKQLFKDYHMSVFKNYCSPTCVTKWKVEPNMADPISLNKKRLLPEDLLKNAMIALVIKKIELLNSKQLFFYMYYILSNNCPCPYPISTHPSYFDVTNHRMKLILHFRVYSSVLVCVAFWNWLWPVNVEAYDRLL